MTTTVTFLSVPPFAANSASLRACLLAARPIICSTADCRYASKHCFAPLYRSVPLIITSGAQKSTSRVPYARSGVAMSTWSSPSSQSDRTKC